MTSFVTRISPKKLVSNCDLKSSNDTPSTGPMTSYPALLINTSTLCLSFTIFAKASFTDFSLLTSGCKTSRGRFSCLAISFILEIYLYFSL